MADESFAEQLAKDSQLALWQAYCDKKMECENLAARLAEAEQTLDVITRMDIKATTLAAAKLAAASTLERWRHADSADEVQP